MTFKNNRVPLLCYGQALCIISKPWMNSNWNNSLETLNSGQNRWFFVPCDPEIWRLLRYFKLCASFRTHWWIQTGVTVRKRPIWVKIGDFLAAWLEIWRMTLKNNMAPLLCYFKLCAPVRSHWWIQTRVTVRKRLFWDKIDDFRVTLKLDRWSWKKHGTFSMLLQALCIIS